MSKAGSVLITLKGKPRSLRNARITGPIRIEKIRGIGRHTQVEIHGLEIDGFGADVDRETLTRTAPKD